MKKCLLLLALLLSFPQVVLADMESYFQKVQQDVKETWKSDEYDLYVPFWAWHNRLFYDQEHIDKYNEEPWGLGLGVSRYDEDGDWHSIYAMGFKDSNNYLQTIMGYAYQKNWYLDCDRDWAVGVGYTLSLTQRHEYNYIPLPLPLPLAGFSYKGFAVQAAYVPGLKNNGNILFSWMRIPLN